MIVLDTSILIDILRGDAGAVRFAASLRDTPACSEITRVEVLRGLRSAERRPTERLLATLRWIAVDEAVARKAGEYGRSFRRRHGLGTADLIIAATADVLGAKLATTNARDFPMFRGLRTPY